MISLASADYQTFLILRRSGKNNFFHAHQFKIWFDLKLLSKIQNNRSMNHGYRDGDKEFLCLSGAGAQLSNGDQNLILV